MNKIFALTFTFFAVTPKNNVLVEVKKINPHIKLDIKYATENNFTGKKVYKSAKCFVHKDVAQKLNNIQKELESMGLGLLIWDAYRPISAQKTFWEICPDERYVIPPSKGSRHNRGVAIDCTIIKKDGNLLKMPTEFDDFSEKAHAYNQEFSEEIIKNRKLLQKVMTDNGFQVMKWEWWHFDLVGWENYPILSIEI